MKAFKSLFPFIKKYWHHLTIGFVFMIVQNYGFTKVPFYMKLILDEISGQNRSSVILLNVAWALGFTALTGLSMFLMRQYIIGASRYIEYELRKVLFEKLTKLDFNFFKKIRLAI